VKPARWLDHLAPWLAWGSVAATGAYAPAEVAVMAAPLAAAAVVEWRGWSLARWRRGLEGLAVGALVLMALLRLGVLPTMVHMLFLLCGVRLVLPRSEPQRRQILLMGFLLFVTTTVSTVEADFLFWAVVWTAAAAALLLRLEWERSARLGPAPAPPPPYLRLAGWALSALALAAGFFVILPRLRLGLAQLPSSRGEGAGFRSGLSQELDLRGKGPIQGSGEVVLRLLPPAGTDPDRFRRFSPALGLLRGFALEDLDGQRWRMSTITPRRNLDHWREPTAAPMAAEFFLGDALRGILPLPYGAAVIQLPPGEPPRFGPGGSLRWSLLRREGTARIELQPAAVEAAPPPMGERLRVLTGTGDPGSMKAALAWSLAVAPDQGPPRELAQRLTSALRTTFSYSLDNPSGGAADPLADFLTRTRAGHCEYFAAALALMLRSRGVPARVVVGYRLGPWLREGGYFLVTQDEAHSWVEYYDPDSSGWRVADPTPPAPTSPLDAGSLGAVLARWTDALRFSWDRNVVRFSDQDQVAGATWIMDRVGALAAWRPRLRLQALAWPTLALAVLLAWLGRIAAGKRWRRPGRTPGRLRELRALVRRARRTLPPQDGETVSGWLDRCARAHPERAAQLRQLAREADAVAYGGRPAAQLKALAAEEARRWA
jgi:hypothetical protein